MLQHFLRYRSKGYSVIPVRKNKKPYFAWKEYQKKIAEEKEIRSWLTAFPDAQIAIISGEISDITVVDVDTHKGADDSFLEYNTTIVRTGSGGFHVWFKYYPGLRTSADGNTHIDIRADGGYFLTPPSCNENGPYSFIREVETLLPFPSNLIKESEQPNRRSNPGRDKILVKTKQHKPYTQPKTTPWEIIKAKKLPIMWVVELCANTIGIRIDWKENRDGSFQIIENGIATSGVINPVDNICHRPSNRQRDGDAVATAEGYLCGRGDRSLYPHEIARWLIYKAEKEGLINNQL